MSCNCEKNKETENIENSVDRRGFLTKLTFAIGGFIGAILALPLFTAMLDPITRKKGTIWRKVGMLSDFKVGETKMVSFENASPYKWAGKISNSAAYLRQETNGDFVAFSVNCAHLGCPVRWEAKAELFMCPCHGGVYYKDGSRAAGPPPRGLYKYPVRIVNNAVEIETESIPITTITS